MHKFFKIIFLIGLFGFCFWSNIWAAYNFDNSLYGELLTKYVHDGLVDYVGLKDDEIKLDTYLKSVAELGSKEFRSMSKYEQMALYINAYNAYTLRAIINDYPVKSIKKIKGVWDKKTAVVAGIKMSLNHIEHGTLRVYYKDPRVHFALNCASYGCPELNLKPYSAEKLEQQLENAAFTFINDRKRNPYNPKKGKFYASSIFKWFKEDFNAIVQIIKFCFY